MRANCYGEPDSAPRGIFACSTPFDPLCEGVGDNAGLVCAPKWFGVCARGGAEYQTVGGGAGSRSGAQQQSTAQHRPALDPYAAGRWSAVWRGIDRQCSTAKVLVSSATNSTPVPGGSIPMPNRSPLPAGCWASSWMA
jgi:hypothetical protein